MAKAAGLDPEQFPEDAEISPDLLEALASQKLTPDDIAIYHDEETGRPVIKSRQEIAQALGGVSEGHIYMVPNGKGQSLCRLFVMLFGRHCFSQRSHLYGAQRERSVFVLPVCDFVWETFAQGSYKYCSQRKRSIYVLPFCAVVWEKLLKLRDTSA